MTGQVHPTWFIWLRAVGGVLFVLSWLVVWLVQRSYIIRRYEDETTLSKLVAFQNPMLAAFSPGMLTGVKRFVYTVHVFTAWILPRAWMRRLPSFSDVHDRREILCHFSRVEIAISVVASAMALTGLAIGVVVLALSPFV